jgi:hypothetical protein
MCPERVVHSLGIRTRLKRAKIQDKVILEGHAMLKIPNTVGRKLARHSLEEFSTSLHLFYDSGCPSQTAFLRSVGRPLLGKYCS